MTYKYIFRCHLSKSLESKSQQNMGPVITGISPKEGLPGTMITLRGENLGESNEDVIMLVICGAPALSYKWKSPSKIMARVGTAQRGVGDILMATKSGGRGKSNVQFRVFIEQIGPLQPSSVWVDESRTVPGREAVRNITEANESTDALGLTIDPYVFSNFYVI